MPSMRSSKQLTRRKGQGARRRSGGPDGDVSSRGSWRAGGRSRMNMNNPIDRVIEKWHAHLRGQLPGGLDELLADDVVFYSPIVYTPQEGKAITKLYLEAAGQTLPGESASPSSGGDGSGRFRYTKTVTSGDTAVLEFETTVDGKYVNGV